jgi:uncharacterized protein YcbK (DUF882 family)
MKYRLIAKTFLFVKGSQKDPVREDAIWLTAGEKKKFTDKQLDKVNALFADMVEKAADKLESQGLETADVLKYLEQHEARTHVVGGVGSTAAPADPEA